MILNYDHLKIIEITILCVSVLSMLCVGQKEKTNILNPTINLLTRSKIIFSPYFVFDALLSGIHCVFLSSMNTLQRFFNLSILKYKKNLKCF